jgi:hypothetical protein
MMDSPTSLVGAMDRLTARAQVNPILTTDRAIILWTMLTCSHRPNGYNFSIID